MERYTEKDRDQVLALSLRAWQPVFSQMARDLPGFVFKAFYPRGWEARQTADISAFLDQNGGQCWIARRGAAIVGFVGVQMHPEDKMGEIHILAVDPDHQRTGIGRALMAYAESVIRDAGMEMVMIETGGDPAHAAARQTYEAADYALWPVARYFKPL